MTIEWIHIWPAVVTFFFGGGVGVGLTFLISLKQHNLTRRMNATEQFLVVAAQAHSRSRNDADGGTGLGEALAAIALVAGLGNDYKFLRPAAIDVLTEIRSYSGVSVAAYGERAYSDYRRSKVTNETTIRYLKTIKGWVDDDYALPDAITAAEYEYGPGARIVLTNAVRPAVWVEQGGSSEPDTD